MYFSDSNFSKNFVKCIWLPSSLEGLFGSLFPNHRGGRWKPVRSTCLRNVLTPFLWFLIGIARHFPGVLSLAGGWAVRQICLVREGTRCSAGGSCFISMEPGVPWRHMAGAAGGTGQPHGWLGNVEHRDEGCVALVGVSDWSLNPELPVF